VVLAAVWKYGRFRSVIKTQLRSEKLKHRKAITLGITANTGNRASHVPTAVYATIVAIESLGVVFCFFLKSPSAIRRDDGQAIAIFRLLSWREEITALQASIMRPETLLLAVAFFGAQIPFTLLGALNGFFFSARTRALATVIRSNCPST
jgi:hypothetical protein